MRKSTVVKGEKKNENSALFHQTTIKRLHFAGLCKNTHDNRFYMVTHIHSVSRGPHYNFGFID